MVKAFLSTFIFFGLSTILFAQTNRLNIALGDKDPSYKSSDKVSVKVTVSPFSYQNLLRHYDADPFVKPEIGFEDDGRIEIEGAAEEYLNKMGIGLKDKSENHINIKVDLCAVNYLLDKGWTATVKFNFLVNVRNSEIWYEILSGYSEEGGGENDINYSEKAMNNAVFNAFESVNWEQLVKSLTPDISGTEEEPELETALERSTEPDKASGDQPVPVMTLGKYHALVIAIEDYQYLNKLDQPVRDASNLIRILASSYSFAYEDIIFLTNPTRGEIIDELDVLVEKVKENDNLLIFYAGHGYWDEERQTGYWLPVDARKNSTANWLRNTTIQEYIGDIKSKHTLLIADACFGGGIFKTRKAFEDAPSSFNQMYELQSRKAITSGMLNEVPDRSVFFEYLFKRLQDNNEKYISSLQLFSSFYIAVMNNSDNVPQYGTIQKAGDEGGDFIFIRSR